VAMISISAMPWGRDIMCETENLEELGDSEAYQSIFIRYFVL
jgi:hypothetical protein